MLLGILPEIIEPLKAIWPDWMATTGTAFIGLAIIILRTITTTSVGKKEQ